MKSNHRSLLPSFLFFLAIVTTICLFSLMSSSDVRWFSNDDSSGDLQRQEAAAARQAMTQRVKKETLSIDDIYFSVKTTGKNHDSRVRVIVDTWFNDAPDSIYFFTDIDADISLQSRTNHQVINTHCKASHSPYDLSCKLGAEYDGYLGSGRKWWCHLDDDVYVHMGNLVRYLGTLDWRRDHYVGRTVRPEEVFVDYHGKRYGVRYITGAAACVSKAAAEKIKPAAANGGIYKTSGVLGHADDLVLGFLLYGLYNVSVTEHVRFHTHFEMFDQKRITDSLPEQIVLGYNMNNNNTVHLNAPRFRATYDETQIYSLYCYYHPDNKFCAKHNGSR